MTKKQDDKRKVRTVIGTGLVSNWSDDHIVLDIDKIPRSCGVQTGDRVEIVAVRPAKLEREVMIPEGAVWTKDETHYDSRWSLFTNCRIACIEAITHSHYQWKIKGKSGHVHTLEQAQQAAYEALATAELYGFRWENVEPEYWFYTVLCDETDHTQAPSPIKWSPRRRRQQAQETFDNAVAEGNWKDVRLLGFNVGSTGDLQMVELDRFEAEEEKQE